MKNSAFFIDVIEKEQKEGYYKGKVAERGIIRTKMKEQDLLEVKKMKMICCWGSWKDRLNLECSR